MSMQPYFEPRERHIDQQYATKCRQCKRKHDEREQTPSCAMPGCKTVGCDTCMQECGDCGSLFCWGHTVRSFDLKENPIMTCTACTRQSVNDAPFEAEVTAA